MATELIGVCFSCEESWWFEVDRIGDVCPEDHGDGERHHVAYYRFVCSGLVERVELVPLARAEAAEQRVRELERSLEELDESRQHTIVLLLSQRDDAKTKLATAVEALRGAEHWMATIAGRLRLRDQLVEIQAEGDRLAAALGPVREALAEIGEVDE